MNKKERKIMKEASEDCKIGDMYLFETHKDRENFLDWIDSLFPEFSKKEV